MHARKSSGLWRFNRLAGASFTGGSRSSIQVSSYAMIRHRHAKSSLDEDVARDELRNDHWRKLESPRIF